MVNYKKITIDNYKTISHAELEFEAGIYKVVGRNMDSRYLSNGSGKTTVLQAMALCLYNRDLSGVNIDHLNNRTTKKGFSITVDMVVDNKIVRVINNRNDPKKLFVFIDGKLEAAGVNNSLPLIESLLGMGFETFKLTHYITSTTITQLTQNLSQPTLFNDILHIIEIQELDKILLQVSKDVAQSLHESKSSLQSIIEQEQLLSLKSQYDKDNLEETLSMSEQELDVLESSYTQKYTVFNKNLLEINDAISKLDQTISYIKDSLKSGICSMCNTILLDKDSLIKFNEQLKEAEALKETTTKSQKDINSKLILLNKKYNDVKVELVNSINKLKQEVGVANEIASFTSISLDKDKTQLELSVKELESEMLFITTARKEIKTGKVIKEVMDKFFKVIEFKLKQYSELINLEHFDISVKNDKLGMAVYLEQKGQQVPIDSLSNGEKTRLSLLILVSMLDAMKAVTDSNDNYLVFDEASSSFDKSGIEELEKLFSYLKNLGQSCFVITHGSEMDQVPYDKELLVTKEKGLSTIEIRDIK